VGAWLAHSSLFCLGSIGLGTRGIPCGGDFW